MKWNHPTAYSAWGDEERIAIERVIDSGQFTMGDEVAAFESEFAAFHGKPYGIMVNSGSSANLIAVAALFHVKHLPLKRGDLALVPAIAWATTYAPLAQYGLQIELVDVGHDWNADPDKMLTRHADARLVVGCSILGAPADLARWRDVAGVIDAYLLEDNCESVGAQIGGKLCGTFGDLNTFSFFWSHQISAIEGGMILTDNIELDRLCRMLRDHGMTRSVRPALELPAFVGFDQEYDFRLFGYNVRPLEMHAAIAREQLKKLPAMIEQRTENLLAFIYAATGEADLPILPQLINPTAEPSPFGLAFLLRSPEAREKAVAALRLAGIDCRLPTGGSFGLHAYGAACRDQETPFADEIHRQGLFLGNAPRAMTEEIATVVRVLKEADL